MAIGPSGSGKSHYFEVSNQKDHILLSSDKFRSILGTGEEDQSVSYQAFKTMETCLEYFLKFTDTTIYLDATFLYPKARKPFLEIAKNYQAEVKGICFKRSIEICLERNQLRSRQVPNEIIFRQFDKLSWPDENEIKTLIWL